MLEPQDDEKGSLETQVAIAQMFETFTGKEIAGLVEARERYLRGELNESSVDHKRLEFARWLYEHNKLEG